MTSFAGPPGGAVVLPKHYRICPRCGNFSHFSENQTYCVICGSRLLEECPGCHEAIIYPTAKFCAECGERLIGLENPAA